MTLAYKIEVSPVLKLTEPTQFSFFACSSFKPKFTSENFDNWLIFFLLVSTGLLSYTSVITAENYNSGCWQTLIILLGVFAYTLSYSLTQI